MVVLFDNETTGLIDNRTLPLAKQPAIVEFYACRANLVTGEIYAECEHFINPQRKSEEAAFKAHGLTDEFLATQEPFSAYADEIRSFVESAPTIIAHNLSFDMEQLEIAYERLAQPPPRWPTRICTVEQTVHLCGRRLTLSDLHQYLFGKPHADAHRAKTDVMALLRCAAELHKRDLL